MEIGYIDSGCTYDRPGKEVINRPGKDLGQTQDRLVRFLQRCLAVFLSSSPTLTSTRKPMPLLKKMKLGNRKCD